MAVQPAAVVAKQQQTKNPSISRSWGPKALIITGIVLFALSLFVLTYMANCHTLPFSATQILLEVLLCSIATSILGIALLLTGIFKYCVENDNALARLPVLRPQGPSAMSAVDSSSTPATAGQPPAAPNVICIRCG